LKKLIVLLILIFSSKGADRLNVVEFRAIYPLEVREIITANVRSFFLLAKMQREAAKELEGMESTRLKDALKSEKDYLEYRKERDVLERRARIVHYAFYLLEKNKIMNLFCFKEIRELLKEVKLDNTLFLKESYRGFHNWMVKVNSYTLFLLSIRRNNMPLGDRENIDLILWKLREKIDLDSEQIRLLHRYGIIDPLNVNLLRDSFDEFLVYYNY
jgi:hypothetical protein